MLKTTVSIHTATSGELVTDGEIDCAGSFAVSIGCSFPVTWLLLGQLCQTVYYLLLVTGSARFQQVTGIWCGFGIVVSPFVLCCQSGWHREWSCHPPGRSPTNSDMFLHLFCISSSCDWWQVSVALATHSLSFYAMNLWLPKMRNHRAVISEARRWRIWH